MQPGNQPSEPNSFKLWIRQHELISFFGLAYAISWILSIPFILSEWGVLHGDYRIAFIIKSFGPYLAAVILTRYLCGRDGWMDFRSRMRKARVGWLWYLASLVGIPALLFAGILVQPGATAGFKGLQGVVAVQYLANFILVAFGGGPLGEEPGWRGFALPRLQKQHGPLVGTLLLAIGWTCWHLPDFLTSAQGGGPGTGISAFLVNFPVFLGLVTAIAFLFTWVYNHTGGSVFMTILAHASVNTPQVALIPLFPAVDTTRLNLAALIGFGVAALVIILVTKGKLGYQPTVE